MAPCASPACAIFLSPAHNTRPMHVEKLPCWGAVGRGRGGSHEGGSAVFGNVGYVRTSDRIDRVLLQDDVFFRPRCVIEKSKMMCVDTRQASSSTTIHSTSMPHSEIYRYTCVRQIEQFLI